MLDKLQRVTEFARSDKAKFISIIRTEKDKASEKALKSKTSQLAKNEKRIAELDTIISRIYEDHVGEKISAYRFRKMLTAYEDEQSALTTETETLQAEITNANEEAHSIEKFLNLCEIYTDFTVL